MTIIPAEHNHNDIYKLLIGSIVPRPIGFISTVDPQGHRNLAPFSFFSAVCSNPPVILFSPSIRKDSKVKDTLRNVQTTKEFVANIVSEDIAEQMNACSAEFPPEVDEFTVSGLTPLPSDAVKPARVKESLVQMECKLINIITFGSGPGSGSTVFGEVVRFHVADEILSNFRIDAGKLRAIGRMGGPTYARTTDLFDMARPKTVENPGR